MATKKEREQQERQQRQQFLRQLKAKISLAFRNGGTRYTHFLDPAQRKLAEEFIREQRMRFTFFGGYDDAQRVIAAIYSGDRPSTDVWPMVCVRAEWSRFAARPHWRDFVKAEKALGLPEDCFGDVVVGKLDAYLMVERDVAKVVMEKLAKAGKTPLTLSEAPDGIPMELRSPQGIIKRVSVSSLRLDDLSAVAWGLKPEEVKPLIQEGRVCVNCLPTLELDAKIRPGDVYSCPPFGKVRLLTEEGPNRARMLRVNLFIYANN